MEALATTNGVIFVLIVAIIISTGIALKRWQRWLLSVYCFLTFLLVGMTGTGSIYESVKLGAIMTFIMLLAVITTRWTRERAKKSFHKEEEEQLKSIRKLDMRPTSSEDKSPGQKNES